MRSASPGSAQLTTSGKIAALRHWFERGAWTVIDQVLFAGSNFLVNIWLARTLTPDEYGIFTLVGYVAFLLASALHTGALTEPQLVFGAGRFLAAPRAYLRTLLVGHSLFSAVIAVAYAAWGLVMLALDHPLLGTACLVMAVSQSALLGLRVLRYMCYVRYQPFVAVTGGLVYLGVVLAGLGGAGVLASGIHVPMAFVILGLAGAAASGWIYIRLDLGEEDHQPAGFRRDVLQQHVRYGRWATPNGIMEIAWGLLPFVLLSYWAGLEAVGALRALFNLLLPITHIYGALSDLMIPAFVSAHRRGALTRVALLATLGFVATTSVYGLLLGVFGDTLILLLYGGQYLDYAPLTWLLAAEAVVGAAMVVVLSLLRALEQPRLIFGARALAAVLAATGGAVLVYYFEVLGALLSLQLSLMLETCWMVGAAWMLWKSGWVTSNSLFAEEASPADRTPAGEILAGGQSCPSSSDRPLGIGLEPDDCSGEIDPLSPCQTSPQTVW